MVAKRKPSRQFVVFVIVLFILLSGVQPFAVSAKTISQKPVGTNQQANYGDVILDPSFELYTPNPYWSESSANFGTPLCTLNGCGNGAGTAGPRSGSVWAWFGGVPFNESGSLAQTVTFPNGISNLRLQFYFWIGAAASGSDAADVFTVQVDGATVFSANATQRSSYSNYTPISVDVSAYSDGNAHTITFSSVTTTQLVTFNLDDVRLSDQSFFDVPSTHPYYQDIEILYANGLTAGCSSIPINFCPETIMNRGESSVFMLKGNFGNTYTPPLPPWGTFKDNWSSGTWAEKWAEGMYDEGLTAGCALNPLRFCPWDQTNREQAAVFGLKLKYGNAYLPPPATGNVFADMTDPNHWSTRWTEQAYADGLLPSCGTDTGSGKPFFCPTSLVSRGLAAYMIVRAKNLSMP